MDYKDKKCIYIPSIDAKDLYLANNFLCTEKNEVGYKLMTRRGGINYSRYINSLDYSLDVMELRNIASSLLPKREPLTFKHNGKEYSNKIINITFKYSVKEFNKIKKNTYVKFGYDLADLRFHDSIAVGTENGNNEIIGIITDTPVDFAATLPLPRGFECTQDSFGRYMYICKTVNSIDKREELRKHLYENGFICEKRHYVRLKRSSGSARVGKCLFIDERLYDKMHEWEMCGLKINEGDQTDLAALEAYISLPTSSIIDTLTIDPKNILVIPDYESNFSESSIVIENKADGWLKAEEKDAEISNSIFDGQSLIDISIMNNYSKYGMVLLRNRFFKSCCFNTNIQQWFADNNITSLSQLHPDSFTLAERISDIKLITTPNSIKYVKFGSVEQWLANIRSVFGVVKHEKKTHYFDGRLVQSHYQLLNTVQLTRDEVKTLLRPSLEYVSLLNTDTDILKHCIKFGVRDEDDLYMETNVMKNKNDIVYTMMNRSDTFYKTKYFHDFKKETCKAYRKNLRKGHILIEGNYSTLFGNPYEMLLQSIGKFKGSSSLPPGYIHTKRFEYGKRLLGCRSPHISTSNILVSTNIRHDLIDKYFNLTDEIVCINAINENTLERLSGADYDSDQMIVSDNELLINAALRNYDVFKVPFNKVVARKVQRSYSNADKADLDHKTSDNMIGEIINLSQELNTFMWDIINRSTQPLRGCYEDIKEIYYDICLLNVLSCLEIDKAKKEFDVRADAEIKRIKKKWMRKSYDNKVIKPKFLGEIAKTKGYYDSEKKVYKYHKTAMDYIIKEINSHRSPKTDVSDMVPLSQCFYFDGFNQNSVNKKQLKNIVQMCESTQCSISAIWAKKYYDSKEKSLLVSFCKDELASKIQDLRINKSTMYVLLTYTDSEKHSSISKLLFDTLFSYKHVSLVDMLNDMTPKNSRIEQSPNGNIELYGIKFQRCKGGDI